MLDEMTAALPANLTERVLEVVGRQRGGDRSVIFISHRMIEIAAVCDRATVLREGETVGVVDVTEGSEERIVELMLGEARRGRCRGRMAGPPPRHERRADSDAADRGARPRLRNAAAGRVVRAVPRRGARGRRARGPGPGRAVRHPRRAPSGRAAASSSSTATPVSFRHPADAIRAGLVYVPADRAEALLMQRSVRENIALPFTAPVRRWGLDRHGRREGEGRRRDRDARRSTPGPQGEVRRLSGGNQQKVTIARWVAGGVRTMLCFDPTRGHRHPDQAPDLRAAARPGRGRRGGPALHLGAQGDPARLRPGDRHLRRPGRGRDRRRRRRRADAAARRIQPPVRRRDARGGRRRGRRRGGRRAAEPSRRRPVERPCRGRRDAAAATSRRPTDDRRERARSRPPEPARRRAGRLGAPQRLDARARRVPRRCSWSSRSSSSRATASRASRASRSRSCRSPSPPSPRRSSSSPAGSTSRSAR